MTIETTTTTDTFEPIQINAVELSIPCTPWCAIGGDHDRSYLFGERYCQGREHLLVLHLEPWINQAGEDERPDLQPDYLTTSPVKDFNEEPKVFIGRHEANGVYLTPDEARMFAQELLLIVAQIEASA